MNIKNIFAIKMYNDCFELSKEFRIQANIRSTHKKKPFYSETVVGITIYRNIYFDVVRTVIINFYCKYIFYIHEKFKLINNRRAFSNSLIF